MDNYNTYMTGLKVSLKNCLRNPPSAPPGITKALRLIIGYCSESDPEKHASSNRLNIRPFRKSDNMKKFIDDVKCFRKHELLVNDHFKTQVAF